MNPAENNCHLFAPETPSKEGDEDGNGDSTPIIEEVTVIPLCSNNWIKYNINSVLLKPKTEFRFN